MLSRHALITVTDQIDNKFDAKKMTPVKRTVTQLNRRTSDSFSNFRESRLGRIKPLGDEDNPKIIKKLDPLVELSSHLIQLTGDESSKGLARFQPSLPPA